MDQITNGCTKPSNLCRLPNHISGWMPRCCRVFLACETPIISRLGPRAHSLDIQGGAFLAEKPIDGSVYVTYLRSILYNVIWDCLRIISWFTPNYGHYKMVTTIDNYFLIRHNKVWSLGVYSVRTNHTSLTFVLSQSCKKQKADTERMFWVCLRVGF